MSASRDFRVTVLGSGTSLGVPVIGCDCAVCTSPDPRNRRSRVSVHVAFDEKSVLIDTSPDLRQQALDNDLRRVDAVLLTHAHADHLHGLDDLRVYCARQQEVLPCYATRDTLRRAARGFDYAFERNQRIPLGGIPQLSPRPVNGQPFDLFGARIQLVQLPHGRVASAAFRFDDAFAYVTDCNDIPPRKLDLLRGVDLLVLDCLRDNPHPTHLHLERSLELIEALAPGRAYLTHLSHEFDHKATEALLPEGVHLAYDGLRLQATSLRSR